MFRPRVIPCLLLKNLGLVKTVKFRDPIYLGDPINIVKIFNDKEVDELLFLQAIHQELDRGIRLQAFRLEVWGVHSDLVSHQIRSKDKERRGPAPVRRAPEHPDVD